MNQRTRQWFNLSICIVFNFQRACKHTRRTESATPERIPPVRVILCGRLPGQAKCRIANSQPTCQPQVQLIFQLTKRLTSQKRYAFNCRLCAHHRKTHRKAHSASSGQTAYQIHMLLSTFYFRSASPGLSPEPSSTSISGWHAQFNLSLGRALRPHSRLAPRTVKS